MRPTYVLAIVVSICSPAFATNRGFMPGDAFFHSRLSQATSRRLVEDSDMILSFSRPATAIPSFCGFAGYWRIRLPDESRELARNLKILYDDLRKDIPRELREYVNEDGKTDIREVNGFHLFVYNREFDPLAWKIGLRYNENWVQDESSFGGSQATTRLEFFVSDPKAVVVDWRDSPLIPPLRTRCPPIPKRDMSIPWGNGIAGKQILEPVELDGDIQVIVTDTEDLRSYYRGSKNVRFFSVTNDGIKVFERQKGELQSEDWASEKDE